MAKIRVVSVLMVAALAAPLMIAGCASSSDESDERASAGATSGPASLLGDAALTARVRAALAAAAAKPLSINVATTQGGIVQLSGFVARPEDAQRAVEIARQVNGVQQVYNDIRIVPRS